MSTAYNRLLSLPQKQIPQLLLFLDTLYAIPHNPFLELLSAIDHILDLLYSDLAAEGIELLGREVSPKLRETLSNLIACSFCLSKTVPSTFYFVYQYVNRFRHDFSPCLSTDFFVSNPNFPATTQLLFERLLLWKHFLLKEYKLDFLRYTFEMIISQNRFLPGYVSIPKWHYQRYSIGISSPTIQCIHYHSPVAYKDVHNNRSIQLVDREYRVHRFDIEQIQAVDALLEERIVTFQHHLEQMMGSSNAILQRHLHASIPCYVNIAPTLRLVATHSQNISLFGILQNELGNEFDRKQLQYAVQIHANRQSTMEIPKMISSDVLIHYAFDALIHFHCIVSLICTVSRITISFETNSRSNTLIPSLCPSSSRRFILSPNESLEIKRSALPISS